jgi:hypothetical protein
MTDGCADYGDDWYNNQGSPIMNANTACCICGGGTSAADPTPQPTPVPASVPYTLAYQAYCQSQGLFITSLTECQQAAKLLNLGTTVESVDSVLAPAGCLYFSDTVYYNEGGGIYNSDSNVDKSICRSSTSPFPAPTPMPTPAQTARRRRTVFTAPTPIPGTTSRRRRTVFNAPTPAPTACGRDDTSYLMLGFGYDITKAGTTAAMKSQFVDATLNELSDVSLISNPGSFFEDTSKMGDSLSRTAERVSVSLGLSLVVGDIPILSVGIDWTNDQQTSISAKKQFTSSFYRVVHTKASFNPEHRLQLSDEGTKPAIGALPRGSSPFTSADEQKYFDFFKQFGTHVVMSAGLGGWLAMTSSTSTFECTSRSYKCFGVSADISFKRKTGLSPEATIDTGDCTESDYHNIESNSDTTWSCLGGDPSACYNIKLQGTSAVPDWIASVSCNKYPVELDLQQIGSYVVDAYTKASIDSSCPTKSQFKAMLAKYLAQKSVIHDDPATDFANRCRAAAAAAASAGTVPFISQSTIAIAIAVSLMKLK